MTNIDTDKMFAEIETLSCIKYFGETFISRDSVKGIIRKHTPQPDALVEENKVLMALPEKLQNMIGAHCDGVYMFSKRENCDALLTEIFQALSAKQPITTMGDASTSTKEGVTSPTNTVEAIEADFRNIIHATMASDKASSYAISGLAHVQSLRDQLQGGVDETGLYGRIYSALQPTYDTRANLAHVVNDIIQAIRPYLNTSRKEIK